MTLFCWNTQASTVLLSDLASDDTKCCQAQPSQTTAKLQLGWTELTLFPGNPAGYPPPPPPPMKL